MNDTMYIYNLEQTNRELRDIISKQYAMIENQKKEIKALEEMALRLKERMIAAAAMARTIHGAVISIREEHEEH